MGHYHHTTYWQSRQRDALKPGETFTLRLWSEQPNDLQGVRFVVVHRVGEPSVPEAEYLAHLEREKAERDREWREEQAEREREAAEEAREAAEERRFCQAHLDDEDCWGEGGYEGHRKRERERREVWERRQRELASRPPPPPAPEPPACPTEHPSAAPPPARAEQQPPRASPNAEWITGYYAWEGCEWLWLGGWWTVPDGDRAARRTAFAPAPPPPLRVEVLPAARDGWVWVGGYWAWGGRDWVWVGGRWAAPPRAGMSWRAPRWERSGARVRLVPGVWLGRR